jgi:hypothetical protein
VQIPEKACMALREVTSVGPLIQHDIPDVQGRT